MENNLSNSNKSEEPMENEMQNLESVDQTTDVVAADGFNYEVLKDFCQVRNVGNVYSNGTNPTPRVQFIIQLLERLGIEYEMDVWSEDRRRSFFSESTDLADFIGWDKEEMIEKVQNDHRISEADAEQHIQAIEWAFEAFEAEDLPTIKESLRTFETENKHKEFKKLANLLIRIKTDQEKEANFRSPTVNFYNIYLRGTSNRGVMAHHDIVNPHVDNCNDNSASVINAIAAKTLMPELNVFIVDGEEVGGIGSSRAAEKINAGEFGDIEFVLNLELTACGGKNFFVENFPSSALFQKIREVHPTSEISYVPFHDGIILRKHGIDSVVINPLPRLENGRLDMSLLSYCHSNRDTIALANFADMKEFVEEVMLPILRS